MSEEALSVLLEHTANRAGVPDASLIERSIVAGSARVGRRRTTRIVGTVAAACLVSAGSSWAVTSVTFGGSDSVPPAASPSVRVGGEDVADVLASLLPESGVVSDRRNTADFRQILGDGGGDSIPAVLPGPTTIDRAASVRYTEKGRAAEVGITIARLGGRADFGQLCSLGRARCTSTRAGELVVQTSTNERGPVLAFLDAGDWVVLVAASDQSVVSESLAISIALDQEWLS